MLSIRSAISQALALMVPVGLILVAAAVVIGLMFGERVEDGEDVLSSESGRAYLGDDQNIHLAPSLTPSELKTFIVHDGEGKEISRFRLRGTGGFLLESIGSGSRPFNIDTRPGHPTLVTFPLADSHQRLEIEIQENGSAEIFVVDIRSPTRKGMILDAEGTLTTKPIAEISRTNVLSRPARSQPIGPARAQPQ